MSLGNIDDTFRQTLLTYYKNQRGGALQFPVYHGAEFQYGNGIGDIFRSIGRFLLPIVAPIAKSFISSTASGLSEGKSLKDSLKSAIKPTISEGISQAGTQIMSRVGQAGGGRRRLRKRNKHGKATKSRSSKRKHSQSRVYKETKRKTLQMKKLRYLPQNF